MTESIISTYPAGQVVGGRKKKITLGVAIGKFLSAFPLNM
jgi:hypothetical protein